MSKKSKKTPAPRKAGQRQSGAHVEHAAGEHVGGRRHVAKPTTKTDLRALRIVAIVTALLLLAGLAGMVAQFQGDYPPNAVVTALLVALLIGLSAFAAVRTEDFARFFSRFQR